ncbi:PLP-dependent aminotransferase family protein [Paenibacillus sp. WQ 127069]|uniref:PLP-dependent aminotransferase family protein n=1 Tax=Paenibacillus baimaensis TaxID=2982185 RepID=A0ABT2URT1_9BACL|nr:PLP-dependent aminotransferase family protein [Paenibacillus sp. WQ 127069]MCU6796721.1 PLP-dependent aminotransferase family protein [Paenibacillus sp. WQ 127069]
MAFSRFAKRMDQLKASEIREILKLTERPEVISFAGGLPDPELFPIRELQLIAVKVLEEHGKEALQYATTEGYRPLRDKIALRMNRTLGTAWTADNILITSGSQQGIDLAGKAFLDEGDVIFCESPSYLGAIQAFRAYGPEFVEVPTDHEGMDIVQLRELLQTTQRAKLIYVIPDFQNPTGRSWTLARRQELIKLANEFDLVIIEDNPYGELRFEGEPIPSLQSLDTEGRVLHLGTFSKTFCPGLRMGWTAADSAIIPKLVLLKQGADLQASTISQRQLDAYLETYDLGEQIVKIVEVYRKRRDTMMEALRREMPADVRFNIPSGGLFTWLELAPELNARDLLVRCLDHNVAFVPGGSFYPNGGHENTLRLNYSNMTEERIIEGIARLGKVLREYTAELQASPLSI